MTNSRQSAGFTMIELVLVIILIGIMAVVAAPRLGSLDAYNVTRASSELVEVIRYAQEQAMANVAVDLQVVTGGGDEYRVREYVHASSTTQEVTSPLTGSSPFINDSAEWSNITASALSLSFDSRGYPCNSTAPCSAPMTTQQTITISAPGETRTITIEPITGYVYAN